MHQDLTEYFTLAKRLNRAAPDDALIIANTKSQLRRLADRTTSQRVRNQISLVLMDSPGDLTGTN